MKSKIRSYHHRKVVVVGAGSVGATYSYALAQSGLAALSRSAAILRKSVDSLLKD